jgi:hypothetical protein
MELTMNVLGAGGEVFVESFGGFKGNQNATQFKTGLNVACDGKVHGWAGSGSGTMHAVDRSFKGGEVTPSDWAIMIFEDNVITSNTMAANVAGTSYRVDFETSPAVYAASNPDQATIAGDTLLFEVLRADNSVLASTTNAPGAWTGKMTFTPASLQYKGDGSGDVRVRIGPSKPMNSGRFSGAVDNITVREMKGNAKLTNTRKPPVP